MLQHRARLALASGAVSLGLVTAAAPGVTAVTPWHTTPTVHTATKAKMTHVVDLRWSRHAHFDRVVVDIRGRRPAYSVRYTRQLLFDPSGKPVPLRGRKKVSLSISPASTHDKAGTSVYDGPRLRQAHLPSLRVVALTGDFEGVVSFGFTTSGKVPYRVFTLTDPTRLVVDFHH